MSPAAQGDGEATLAELASRHSVHATQIATWRKLLLEHAGEVFDNGNPGAEDAERRIRDLQAKVGELTMERDFFVRSARSIRPAERKTMIDHESKMTILRQCELLEVCRSSLYYEPTPVSPADLALMRALDELHLKHPFPAIT